MPRRIMSAGLTWRLNVESAAGLQLADPSRPANPDR
jgi:hypothetical protein